MEVTRETLPLFIPEIHDLIRRSEFLALDLEFSGIYGKNSNAVHLEERFKGLSEVVRSHAVVSLGLAFFVRDDPIEQDGNGVESGADSQKDGIRKYSVHTFNVPLMNQRNFTVNPSSLAFLAANGFDFNRMAMLGVPYWPGVEAKRGNLTEIASKNDQNNKALRGIFRAISETKVPLVLHNGLIDLMFVYHSFFTALPKDLATFVADVGDMFGGGVTDTKYFSDYVTREKRSYLLYLFSK